MKKQNGGFTLIELIMVIVILGILAATAIPKFLDLSDDAENAALDGVLGAVNAALAINYADNAVNGTALAATCDDATIGALLAGGSMPSGYTVSGTAPACVLTQSDSSKTANFTTYAP